MVRSPDSGPWCKQCKTEADDKSSTWQESLPPSWKPAQIMSSRMSTVSVGCSRYISWQEAWEMIGTCTSCSVPYPASGTKRERRGNDYVIMPRCQHWCMAYAVLNVRQSDIVYYMVCRAVLEYCMWGPVVILRCASVELWIFVSCWLVSAPLSQRQIPVHLVNKVFLILICRIKAWKCRYCAQIGACPPPPPPS